MKLKIVDLRTDLKRHSTKKYRKRMSSAISQLVLHSNGLGLNPTELNDWFMASNPVSLTGCPRSPYHYYIETDGECFYMTDREDISWHAGNHNPVSVGICFKQSTQYPPTEKALNTARNLLARLCLALNITPQNVFGHRELYNTGWYYRGTEKFYRRRDPWQVSMIIMRRDVSKILQTIFKKAGFYKGKIDGVFGRKSKKAMKKFSRKVKKG